MIKVGQVRLTESASIIVVRSANWSNNVTNDVTSLRSAVRMHLN
jgi:hypothetical protein